MNYAALTDVLVRQATGLENMQQLLEREKTALLESNPCQLDEIGRKKMLLHQELQFLEEKRVTVCAEGKTLFAIIEASPQAYRPKLAELREKMRGLTTVLQETNALNKLLLEQALAYTKWMQGALSVPKEALYGPGGSLRQEGSHLFPLTRGLNETA